jgi:prepilin-type N-terminal cleavage/methylation domain-containing protein
MMKRHLQKGFTLVEVLVYLAIFVMVTTAATYLLITLNDVVDRYRVNTVLYRSGSSALEHMVVELRQANQFNVAGSVVNTAATGTLAVINNSTSTTFTKSGDEILLSINSVDYGNIVDDAVEVDGFTVYQYNTAVGTLVRLKLELTAAVGSSTKSMTFYGGSVIRGDL